ncbi:hypothetical protein DSAG12_00707 [Promethearchaeum syntrophicum]|uniref:Uncharacterized protein n=1 Tax=Promethearchaeum syntrophicum TaxID=2594042 RepID=A0A5B9D8F3_9ARCH|nr:hypothetical protein [Candidatus Prometheoarchaeum syntrophicum]QEE14886.1 hypothetical protein DSAG12_00707 [Candidatus Prometheoarchaeum syntrophicum]
MPKIKKAKKIKEEKLKNLEIQKGKVKNAMFSSTLITYLLAALFLLISFIFNGNIITGWVENVVEAKIVIDDGGAPSFLYIMDIIIKSFSVILFFFFLFISIGNFQEYRGYIMTWKEMIVIFVISLLQVSSNFTTFFITTIGITICITYFYFLQGKIEKRDF